MDQKRMEAAFKAIRISFFLGQALILLLLAYLLFENKKELFYPLLAIFSIQQLLFWGDTFYFARE